MRDISIVSSDQSSPYLAIVIPIKTADTAVEAFVNSLLVKGCEVVIVQATPDESYTEEENVRRRCEDAGAIWVVAPASRGGQIVHGIANTRAALIWVLHIDSAAVGCALDYLLQLSRTNTICWGRFDIRLLGDHWGLAWVSWTMNWRSRLRRICTGDQGMFFHRVLLEQIGGFPSQQLMEDIEVSKRLRRVGAFQAPQIAISSSGERWLRNGFWRTVFTMWLWRLRYFFGASAQALYREYYARPSRGDS